MGTSPDTPNNSTPQHLNTEPKGASEPPSSDGLTQDTAFEVLSNERRRYLLHYLFQQENTVSVRDLSAQLAAWENGIAIDEISYEQRRRVYTALRQVHLPKLMDADIIEYDSRQASAELTDEASELEVYLHVVPHEEIPWSTYYTGLGILTFGLLVGVSLNLFPLRLLPDLAWAFIVVLLFTGSALAHRYREQQMRLGTSGKPPI